MEKDYTEHVKWLLERIKYTIEERKWPASKKNIFQGCYDVWYDEEDRKTQTEHMSNRLEEAKNLGLIIDEPMKGWGSVWKITPLGEEYLR